MALKRRPRFLLLGLGAAAVSLAAWCDWLHPARPWQEATGWDRLPPDERPPAPDERLWNGPEAPRLLWLGHAGFVLRWHGVTVLLDPNASGRCTVAKRQMEPCGDVAALGPVDAVLISHAHFDHLDLPTLRALDGPAVLGVPRGAEEYLDEEMRPRARGVDAGEGFQVGALEAVAVPARHNGNRHHPLKSRKAALGWILRDGHDAVYYAGDTGYGDHFARVRDRYHPRVAILPIGAYSPRLVLAPHHLSPEEAVLAGGVLGVETVVPCHFGTFTLFLDRPSAALPRFAHAAAARGLLWRMPVFFTGASVPGQNIPGGKVKQTRTLERSSGRSMIRLKRSRWQGLALSERVQRARPLAERRQSQARAFWLSEAGLRLPEAWSNAPGCLTLPPGGAR